MERPPRIEAALAAYLEFVERGGEETDPAEFLSSHEDLRDLLEPMLSRATPLDEGHGAQELGDFRLLRELGRGGMGVVYEAHQRSLDRRVALKAFLVGAGASERSLARFKREALTLARLDHPGIVRVLAVGSVEETHWYAMELLGDSLESRLAQHRSTGQPSPAERRTFVAWIAQVAEALAFAHDAGVVHRDVKPANILLRDGRSAVLSDFGLAHEVDLPSLTLAGGILGTPHYMAPEQVAGGRVDARTDVFSLGATLYECLTLARPFPGGRPEQVLAGILHAQPVDPLRIQPDLAPELVAICLKALERDPQDRYPDARAFADDLRAWLADRPVRARRTSTPRRLLRWARRERWKALSLVAVLLLALAAAGLGGYVTARLPEIAAGRAKLASDRLEGLLETGFFEMTFGAPAAAEGAFRSALQEQPGNVAAIGGLAMTMGRRAGDDAALGILEEHRDRVAESPGLQRLGIVYRRARGEDVADLLANAAPARSADDHFFAGLEALRRGERGDRDALREALRLSSLADRMTPTKRLAYANQWLLCAERLGDLEAIREVVRWFDLLERTSWKVLNMHAMAVRHLDPRRACELLERALELEPGDERLHFNLGLLRLDLGELDAAALCFERAGERSAEFAEAWTMLGEVHARAGRLAEARTALERSIRIDPTSGDADFNLARVHALSGEEPERLAAARRAVERNGSNAFFHNELGATLEVAGDATGARACYETAVRLAPAHPSFHRNLAALLARLEDWSALRAELARFAEVRQEDDAWLALARFDDDAREEGHRDASRAAETARRLLGLERPVARAALEILRRSEGE